MTQTGLVRSVGHVFHNPALFDQALTHRSHSGLNNERLEFLGDGLLNLVVAHQLYQRFPKLSEGDLSRLRAQLVKESTLADVAKELNIGDSLKLGEGELKSGGWRRPSVLADALEAIIGALFLDGGFAAAESFVVRIYATRIESIDPKVIGKDPKSLLQEYLQAKKKILPDYEVLEITGEAHEQFFKIACKIPSLGIEEHGEGSSRKVAEQQAASLAYKALTKELKA